MSLNSLFKSIKPVLVKHEPEILMGMGIGGLVFSTTWGIKATFAAVKRLEKRKKELQKEKLSFKEGFKEVWTLYLPVVLSAGLSIPSIILGNRVSARRNAAFAAAYAISETALQEYREQTRELVGEKKEKEIREKISEKKVNETYNSNNVLLTGDGDCLFCEPISGRYFKSNWNKILKAANELNARSMSNLSGVTTLTDWFDELGLSPTDISDRLGWSLADGQDGIIDIDVMSSLTPDKVPCGSISYNVLPRPC